MEVGESFKLFYFHLKEITLIKKIIMHEGRVSFKLFYLHLKEIKGNKKITNS